MVRTHSATTILLLVLLGFLIALITSRLAPTLWNACGSSFSSFIGRIPHIIEGLVSWFSSLLGN